MNREEKQKLKAEKKQQKAKEKQARKEVRSVYKETKGNKDREIKWGKLDNTAHLFPVIAGEGMTNVYRVAVILKEEIQQELLQQALDMVLPKFSVFNCRLRQGMFWYYFEENGKKSPTVHEEHTYPCRYIDEHRNRSYLFRVTYYGCRINLEVFHSLTDGNGALNFLKELTYQYLRLSHPELGEQYGKQRGYKINYFPADWKTFGKSAGYIRNQEMAENADALVAFWDGKSRGTANMIDIAQRYNLRVRIVRYKQE